MSASSIFDDMGGRFVARLREHRDVIHTLKGVRGEGISLRGRVGILEAKFDLGVLDRLHRPCFVAIERTLGDYTDRGEQVNGLAYLVYEVTRVNPTHFQMLAINAALPTVVRKEYLETIYGGWGISDETWVDVQCAPTGYMMWVDKGKPVFSQSVLLPLAGAPAHMLSKEATKAFLCVEQGVPIGKILGFDVDLTVDIENLIKYHAGVFGFTGTGKSNLTSQLIRSSLNALGESIVVVFDVAGEYAVNLADILSAQGLFYSTENIDDVESFLRSQTLPETLESRVNHSHLEKWADGLLSDGRVRRLQVGKDDIQLTIGFLLDHLDSYVKEKKTGGLQALALYNHILSVARKNKIGLDTPLTELPADVKNEVLDLVENTRKSLNDRSALYGELGTIKDSLSLLQAEIEGSEALWCTPKKLAHEVVSNDASPLIIVYTPDPVEARKACSSFIGELLYVKKHGYMKRVTVVLDEAQEFIPYEPHKEDLTADSSLAVEALLRQGRKYRAHCVLATQRVARLNTNALQQLHSYFVSTMPRSYDRGVVAEAFSLNYEVIERTTELDTGQWLFVSFKSTKQRNVPVFINTPNNEDRVVEWFNIFYG
ncbi:MAG: ATP-binding protein [Thermoprotei archaeon]